MTWGPQCALATIQRIPTLNSRVVNTQTSSKILSTAEFRCHKNKDAGACCPSVEEEKHELEHRSRLASPALGKTRTSCCIRQSLPRSEPGPPVSAKQNSRCDFPHTDIARRKGLCGPSSLLVWSDACVVFFRSLCSLPSLQITWSNVQPSRSQLLATLIEEYIE